MGDLAELLSLFQCTTPESWRDTLLGIARHHGFGSALFGLLASKSAQLDSAFLVSNYPREWRLTYDKLQLHAFDPTFVHCGQSALPILWSPDIYKSRPQQEFYERACGYGLRTGLSFPLHGPNGEFGIFSLVANDNQHAAHGGRPEQLAMLGLLRDYALESALRFLHHPRAQATRTKVTPRELECLRWIMAGKSSWEIARILSCSEATINFHVANVKKKFDVLTRQQAVVRAIKEKLITPD